MFRWLSREERRELRFHRAISQMIQQLSHIASWLDEDFISCIAIDGEWEDYEIHWGQGIAPLPMLQVIVDNKPLLDVRFKRSKAAVIEYRFAKMIHMGDDEGIPHIVVGILTRLNKNSFYGSVFPLIDSNGVEFVYSIELPKTNKQSFKQAMSRLAVDINENLNKVIRITLEEIEQQNNRSKEFVIED